MEMQKEDSQNARRVLPRYVSFQRLKEFRPQGLDASLIGVIPYAAVRLGMYDGLKKLHEKVRL